MEEAGLDFNDASEGVVLDHAPDSLQGWHERKLGRTTGEDVGMVRQVSEDRLVGGQIDAEGFLAHDVFAGLDRSAVDLLVQVVRHGDVDGFNVGVCQELAIVVGHLLDGI